MKKSIVTGTILIVLLVFETGFCQKKLNEYRGRTGEALNYQLVETAKWDANVKQVKLSPPSQTSAGSPKITVSQNLSPEGRRLGGQVRIRDDAGNPIYTKELAPNSQIDKKSEDGNYLLMQSILKSVEIDQMGLIRFQLIDSRGTVYWSKDEKLEYEGDNWGYFLANDGSCVKVNATKGLLTFLDRAGNQINEVDLFVEEIWSRGRSIYGKYSPDSRYFLVNASDDVGNTFPTKSGIICFDNQGHEIWRYNTAEEIPGDIWVSPTNQYVIAFSSTYGESGFTSKSTYLLDFQGRLIKQHKEITNDVQFTSNDDHAAFIGDGLRRMRLIDLKTGDIVFEYRTIGKGDSRGRQDEIHAVDVNQERKLVCILKNEEILVLHFNYVPAWSQAISYTETDRSRIFPAIQFSQDAREMVVCLNSGMYRYRLTE